MIYGGHFDIDGKIKKIDELEREINQPDFWNDSSKAQNIIDQKIC